MADVIGGIVAQLSVDATVDAGLQKARQAMAALEAETRQLDVELQKNMITTTQHKVKTDELAAAQMRLGAAMQSAYTRTAASSSAVAVALNGTAVGGMNAAMKMTILGQALDDAQYGFSAIVNQSGQIAAALGLGAGVGGAAMVAGVALNQLMKHGDALIPAAKAVGEYWLSSFNKATVGADLLAEAIAGIGVAVQGTSKWFADLAEGWAALTNAPERAQKAAVDKFTATGTKADVERGRAIGEAIEEHGPARFLEEAIRKQAKIDINLRAPGEEGDAARQAYKAYLIDLLEQAKKGTAAAIFGLQERTAGTEVGAAISGNMPGAKEGRKALEEESLKAQDARVKKWKEDMEKEGKARAETEKDRAKERGKTMEELMVQEEMAEYDQSVLATIRSPRELAKRADLEERRGDLDWRMKLLMNPEKVGQSLGMDAYEGSFKATTGLSEEEKQTHAMQELLKEYQENAAALAKLADVKVVAVAKP